MCYSQEGDGFICTISFRLKIMETKIFHVHLTIINPLCLSPAVMSFNKASFAAAQ